MSFLIRTCSKCYKVRLITAYFYRSSRKSRCRFHRYCYDCAFSTGTVRRGREILTEQDVVGPPPTTGPADLMDAASEPGAPEPDATSLPTAAS